MILHRILMHPWLKIVILLVCMGVFWAFSESFLAPEKAVKQRSSQQLKQEIVERMSSLLDLRSKLIETDAKTQQVLYKQIKPYAEGDKKCFLSSATMQQLQQVMQRLREEQARSEKELKDRERFLAFVTSSMNI